MNSFYRFLFILSVCAGALVSRAEDLPQSTGGCSEGFVDAHANLLCIETFGTAPGTVEKATLQTHHDSGNIPLSGCKFQRSTKEVRLFECESQKTLNPALVITWTPELKIQVAGTDLGESNEFLKKLSKDYKTSGATLTCYQQLDGCGKDATDEEIAYTCFSDLPGGEKVRVTRLIPKEEPAETAEVPSPTAPPPPPAAKPETTAKKEFYSKEYGIYDRSGAFAHGTRLERSFKRETLPDYSERVTIPEALTLSLNPGLPADSAQNNIESRFRSETPKAGSQAKYPADFSEDTDRYCVRLAPAPVFSEAPARAAPPSAQPESTPQTIPAVRKLGTTTPSP